MNCKSCAVKLKERKRNAVGNSGRKVFVETVKVDGKGNMIAQDEKQLRKCYRKGAYYEINDDSCGLVKSRGHSSRISTGVVKS